MPPHHHYDVTAEMMPGVVTLGRDIQYTDYMQHTAALGRSLVTQNTGQHDTGGQGTTHSAVLTLSSLYRDVMYCPLCV